MPVPVVTGIAAPASMSVRKLVVFLATTAVAAALDMSARWPAIAGAVSSGYAYPFPFVEGTFLEAAMMHYDGSRPFGHFHPVLHNSLLYQPCAPVLFLQLLHYSPFVPVCHDVAIVAVMAALSVSALAVAVPLFSYMHYRLFVVHYFYSNSDSFLLRRY